MDFADVSAAFTQGLFADTTRSVGASFVTLTALVEETSRAIDTSVASLSILFDPTDIPPTPPHWHVQWRFIETRL